jgi:hypothetical protein
VSVAGAIVIVAIFESIDRLSDSSKISGCGG